MKKLNKSQKKINLPIQLANRLKSIAALKGITLQSFTEKIVENFLNSENNNSNNLSEKNDLFKTFFELHVINPEFHTGLHEKTGINKKFVIVDEQKKLIKLNKNVLTEVYNEWAVNNGQKKCYVSHLLTKLKPMLFDLGIIYHRRDWIKYFK